ncbi:MAG: amidohydrolase family protein [Gemmatimonadaceae bacterium]|nr:amidohydrolase family protein [Gemmatimonadaceae bacterium]
MSALHAQTTGVTHGVRPARLVIRGATIVDGNGTPARGPQDIVIENGVITQVVPIDPVAMRRGTAKRPTADAMIDATGKFVLPGLINAHAHIQSNRSGQSLDGWDYNLKLWLANGITTAREVGAETNAGSIALREKAARNEIVSPRLVIYPQFWSEEGRNVKTPADARAHIRRLKALGADGIKFGGIDRDLMEAAYDEAHKLNLPTAHHIGVEETTAWDEVAFGGRSIEHWYGVPDAAIKDKRQSFPSDYNYLDETDRFRWAGRLWREADPAILDSLLTAMVKAKVTWVPTLDIYEASRDLQRAQTQPWYKDYLHPALENYFKPDPANHGSYFIGWSTTDEVYWKENYRIWMATLRSFERKGGIIGCGDDAGFIYQMYGFGLIREMELHAEAGFHPLKVIEHCTGNNAKILGMEDKIGRVRAGWLADLIIVDGNPLENLKVLYPVLQTQLKDGKEVRAGIEWTIKDGIPYSVPTLTDEIKAIVAKARAR